MFVAATLQATAPAARDEPIGRGDSLGDDVKILAAIIVGVTVVAAASFFVVSQVSGLGIQRVAEDVRSSSGADPDYEALTEATSGLVIVNDGESAATELAKLQARPVVLLPHPEYFAPPGQEITFNVSTSYSPGSTLVRYDWDYNGDGTFDEVTTNPIVKHTYPEAAELLMQVRVTDANGLAGNASAFVHIGVSPDDGWPAAPTNVTAELTSTSADGISTVQVSWQGSDPTVYRWGLTVDGIPAGMVEATSFTASIVDVHREKDVEIGVVGFTQEGLMGYPSTVLLPMVGQ